MNTLVIIAIILFITFISIIRPKLFFWGIFFCSIIPVNNLLETALPFFLMGWIIRNSISSENIKNDNLPKSILILLLYIVIWYFFQFSLPGEGKTFRAYYIIFTHFIYYYLMIKTIYSIDQPFKAIKISKYIYIYFIFCGFFMNFMNFSNSSIPSFLSWGVDQGLD